MQTLPFAEFGKFGNAPEYDGPFLSNLHSLLRHYGKLELCVKEVLTSWVLPFEDEQKNSIKMHVLEESVMKSNQTHCDNCRVIGWTHHPLSVKRFHFIIPSFENETLYTIDDSKMNKVCTNCKISDSPLQKMCDKCNNDKSQEENKVVSVSDSQNHLLHGLLHTNGFGHLLRINGRDRGSRFLSGSQIMDFWDRLCSMLRARQVSVMDVSKKRNLELRLVHSVAYGKPWYGNWNYTFGKGSYGVIYQDYLFALHAIRSTTLHDIATHFNAMDDEIVRILIRYQKLNGMINCSLPPLKTLGDLFCLFLQIIQVCNRNSADWVMEPGVESPPKPTELSTKAGPNENRSSKNELRKVSPRKNHGKSAKATTDSKGVKNSFTDGKSVKNTDSAIAKQLDFKGVPNVTPSKTVDHPEAWFKPENKFGARSSVEPPRVKENSTQGMVAEKGVVKSYKRKNAKSEKKILSREKIADNIHEIMELLSKQSGNWVSGFTLCNSIPGKVMDNEMLNYVVDAAKEKALKDGCVIGCRYNQQFDWMEYRLERSDATSDRDKKSKSVLHPNSSRTLEIPIPVPIPAEGVESGSSGTQGHTFFQTMRETVQKDMAYIYKNILLEECRISGRSSIALVSSLPHASRLILDSKHLLKDYCGEFERKFLIRNQGWNEEKLKKGVAWQSNPNFFRILCKPRLKGGDLMDEKMMRTKSMTGETRVSSEEKTESGCSLLKLDIPSQLIVVPRTASIGDLKKAISKALRDLYITMDVALVDGIPYLSDMPDSSPLKSMNKRISLPCTMYVNVSGLDKQTKHCFEGGNDDWMVSCLCGTCDDDGEFMVACDRCDTWQHAKCVGLPESDSAPPSFLCHNCVSAGEPCPNL